jgi:dihydroorotate dehydrogenase
MFYRRLLRPVLYSLPAERAHELAMRSLAITSASNQSCDALYRALGTWDPRLRVNALGLTFPNPIGLAAGMDKDAVAVPALGALGFGSVEIGTVTAQPQPGNPRPRLFRLPKDRAFVNRMGFNNRGAQDVSERLAKVQRRYVPLGINIGKSKVVPNAQAAQDYVQSAELLAPYADYLVINVSSPNTPGLRDLQAIEVLQPLLAAVRGALDRVRPDRRIPLLLKIAPDLADADIDAVADLALSLPIEGIIATNTTLSRAGLRSEPAEVEACGAGGLSGAPLKARALEVLARLYARVGERVVLIGAGGIESVDDVWERLSAGATLVQIYTSFVYQGPLLASHLSQKLSARVRDAGVSNLSDLRMRPVHHR